MKIRYTKISAGEYTADVYPGGYLHFEIHVELDTGYERPQWCADLLGTEYKFLAYADNRTDAVETCVNNIMRHASRECLYLRKVIEGVIQ